MGMSKTAFDLLVAENINTFRKIGTYHKEWYLPYRVIEKNKRKERLRSVESKI